MTTLPQTFHPSMPIEIVDDEDVALLLRRENVDPLVCISVKEICHESLEMKPKPPQSSHNLHVNTMHELQRSDVRNMAAHLDDIGEGLTPVANIDTSPHSHLNFRDTTGNQHIPEHDETEPLFNYNREAAPNRYDEQFAHVQRLVPPPCAFYSINSGEVAPRPVTMRLEVGELFPSKKQLQSHVGSYALTNGFQIRVFKSDTTRYQVRCIVEDCNWRLRAVKVHNSDYFQIRKFDNQHTCSTEAQFPHQRQASARVIGEHIQEKFHDHRLYKPKEIIHDMQREFGISCNYHKGYRARHIALEEVQGTPVESYSILPSYLYMLEQANPGTVTDLYTDSSNSITTGVEKVFPNSFHGACAVHLERNMVGHYGRNKTLKQYFERAARVYRESQFLQRMEHLKNINPKAAQYVTDAGIERWARAYSPRKRYNIMSTNIAEAMNNAIKECKELPITGVIDYIREVLQSWFHDRRTAALKLSTQLTTAADVAIAYSGEIHPVGQPSEWLVPEDIASKIVHPPVGRRGPGRPKKNRTPSFGEEVTQRRCTTCHRVGHNSHTYTYPKSSRPSSGMGSTSEIGEASGSHVRSTTEKEPGDDVGVLLTDKMASNLADEEVVDHRSTTVASRRTHGRRLAGRATRWQLDDNSTANRRRIDGSTARYRATGRDR
ncbi:hypothetical protein EZV62_008857 [Acer yangbiense]|uniref:Transposase MuDR plant domain-containing protein n=1 Tax=Acer yangbiense TaxID=1000413 RepID=A0A5C7IF33_9ROSI|nr:hypothetical protein EZV62_008857 [Acer yangbiense]